MTICEHSHWLPRRLDYSSRNTLHSVLKGVASAGRGSPGEAYEKFNEVLRLRPGFEEARRSAAALKGHLESF